MATNHPIDLLKWAVQAPKNELLLSAVKESVKQLATWNPELALKLVERYGNPSLTMSALRAVIKPLSETDPKRAAEILDAVPITFHSTAVNLVADGWAKEDPESAVRFVSQSDVSQQTKSAILKSILWRWAAEDPKSAKEWALRTGSERVLVASLAQFGPVPIAAEALRDAEIGNKEIYIRNLAQRWAETDPLGALAWANDLPNSRDRAITTRTLVESAARKDLDWAAELVNYLPSREERDGFFREFAQANAPSNPRTALDWASRLSDPASRSSATREVMRAWSSVDFPAALEQAFQQGNTDLEKDSFLRAVLQGRRDSPGEKNDLNFLSQLPELERIKLSKIMQSYTSASSTSSAENNFH
jgi:hypothetical protein